MFTIHKTFRHVYLVILIQYFIRMEKMEHITVNIAYNVHAYALYINKTGSGHYILYNSNGTVDNSDFILDIYENVLSLLRFTYPKIRRYVNGRQQHKSMLCAVFVMTFIESMLNPSKSLKEKIKHALAEENRDLFIKDNQFKLLNRNIPRVLPLQTPQIIDDCNIEDKLARLQEKINQGQVRKRTVQNEDLVVGEWYEVHESKNMDPSLNGDYQFSGIFKFMGLEGWVKICTSKETGSTHRFLDALFYKHSIPSSSASESASASASSSSSSSSSITRKRKI
jgi:hypothetical protein